MPLASKLAFTLLGLLLVDEAVMVGVDLVEVGLWRDLEEPPRETLPSPSLSVLAIDASPHLPSPHLPSGAFTESRSAGHLHSPGLRNATTREDESLSGCCSGVAIKQWRCIATVSRSGGVCKRRWERCGGIQSDTYLQDKTL